LAALLVTGSCSLVTVTAQVKIGGDPSLGPASGAVLDLSEATAGGLLLPQVTLSDELSLPAEWVGLVADIDLLESGLMVYNIGGGGLDTGVYVWQGSNGWKLASNGVDPQPTPPTSITVSASPTGSLAPGGTQTLTATVLPVNAGWTTVNWGGNNTATATVDKINLNTATVTGIAAGTTTVIASLDGVSSAPFTITVNPILASGVSITGGAYNAPYSGGTVSRSAAITNAAQATNKNINWTSNNAAVTISPTTSASGANVNIIVASGSAAVAATVTATAADGSGQAASIAVNRAAACAGTVKGSLCWLAPVNTGTQWAAAGSACSGQGFRLPTRAELQAAGTAPVLTPVFSGANYWSSEEFDSGVAYTVFFYSDGSYNFTYSVNKTGNVYYRCVKSM
jgi:hypothetical protein